MVNEEQVIVDVDKFKVRVAVVLLLNHPLNVTLNHQVKKDEFDWVNHVPTKFQVSVHVHQAQVSATLVISGTPFVLIVQFHDVALPINCQVHDRIIHEYKWKFQ